MEVLFENSAFHHITETICFELSDADIISLKLTSKIIKNYFEENIRIWLKKVLHINKSPREFKNWSTLMLNFERTILQKTLVTILEKEYYSMKLSDFPEQMKNPIHFLAKYGDWNLFEHLKLLNDSVQELLDKESNAISDWEPELQNYTFWYKIKFSLWNSSQKFMFSTNQPLCTPSQHVINLAWIGFEDFTNTTFAIALKHNQFEFAKKLLSYMNNCGTRKKWEEFLYYRILCDCKIPSKTRFRIFNGCFCCLK